jgi:two-component system C4-dicarboxylate transport response regulator DctD
MAPTSLAGVTILVVDDDPGVRGLYVTVLRQAGASVMSSGVASEAVGLIELQPPDVVITDLRMPGHDGIWLLRELKARNPGLPVILISGHVEESRRGKLLELGFANVLTKPLPLSDLANAVARVVDR